MHPLDASAVSERRSAWRCARSALGGLRRGSPPDASGSTSAGRRLLRCPPGAGGDRGRGRHGRGLLGGLRPFVAFPAVVGLAAFVPADRRDRAGGALPSDETGAQLPPVTSTTSPAGVTSAGVAAAPRADLDVFLAPVFLAAVVLADAFFAGAVFAAAFSDGAWAAVVFFAAAFLAAPSSPGPSWPPPSSRAFAAFLARPGARPASGWPATWAADASVTSTASSAQVGRAGEIGRGTATMPGSARSMPRRGGSIVTTTNLRSPRPAGSPWRCGGPGRPGSAAGRRPGAAHQHVGPVGAEPLDRGLDLAADRVLADELDERHRLVVRARARARATRGRRLRPRLLGTVASAAGPNLRRARRTGGARRRGLRRRLARAAASAPGGPRRRRRPPRRDLGHLVGRLGHLAGLAHRPPAGRSPHRGPVHEHPAHVGHRLAADEPTLLEQPRVLAVELLERVVGQDGGAGPAGDLQDEGVAPADGAGRRGDQLVGVDRVLVGLAFLAVDAVGERGVDHDGDVVGRVLLDERLHRLVELGEAGRVAALGGDVRTVDDDVCDLHVRLHSTRRPGRSEGRLPLRCQP